MRFSAADTRDHILEAADRLFYTEGLAGLTMERIAERAGVTKKTLYYHFQSKDELLGAYLESRHEPVMERYRRWVGPTGSVIERTQRMFVHLAEVGANPNWRGCGFLRIACELADLPGHPACVAARTFKMDLEHLLRSMFEDEGWPNASELSRTLVVLLDGTIVQLLIHRDISYAKTAARAARQLLAACAPSLLTRAA
jgi:AcrR family transcriptional regulator